MKITVIGCGNGAFATAADLSCRGHEMTLYAAKNHERNFESIIKNHIIRCSGKGPIGDVHIHKITCDIEEAIRESELIIPVVPSYAHEEIARSLVPYIKSGDKIFLSPGSTGGALVFAKVFHEYNKNDGIKIAEVHTLPYTARKVGDDGVDISLLTKWMYFSVFPAKYNQEMYEVIKQLYPNIELVENVLETSLNNGNAVTHPAPVILNAGKIEYYGEHSHYKEGITPSVANVIQAIDDERKAICAALGYKQIDVKERLYKMGYCPLRENVYDCIQGSTDIFLPLKGPNDLNSRYLVEDTPHSLVAMSEIAKSVNVPTPIMDSIVNLACVLKGENYWVEGRTLEKMGINNLSVNEIKQFLHEGYGI